MEQTIIIDEILFALAKNPDITTKDAFHKIKNDVLSRYRVAEGPSHIAMIERYNQLVELSQIPDELRIRKVLRKRAVRSLSGVSVISLLTKFWGCPGKCVYCPTYEGLPKSYISDEPAVQRAEMNEFDAFRQIQNRLQSLRMTGNAISKCDVRIIGGTWSVYPRPYQEDFIRDIYDAHTSFDTKTKIQNVDIQSSGVGLGPVLEKSETWIATPSSTESGGRLAMTNIQSPFTSASTLPDSNWISSATLEEAKKRNETAMSRVIGMAIETRPDWINPEEIIRLRRYGITRVEIGYQTTHDHINELNKRGHGNKESIEATRLLKDAGFKVVAHMMPGLIGATPELDKSAMDEIFSNPDYRPDELKIYPMVVTPNSELTTIWERGEFVPYEDDILIPLMAELQGMIPEYVRLNRMYRDIPAHEILAGSKLANLRQVTEIAMRARGITRHDISAREIRARANNPHDAVIDVLFYEASGGHEYFIQMIDPVDRTLFGICRLRIPSQVFTGDTHFISELDGAAIVRELHVFGDQIPVRVPNPLEKGGQGGLEIVPEKGSYEKNIKNSHIPFRGDLTEKAKELRNNMTGPEKNIWYRVLSKDAFQGLRFLRQKPLLDYIVDFYCPALRLVVEIDGESHIGNEEYDLQRTIDLSKYNIQVIRFTNDEVLSHLEGVYEALRIKILDIQKSNPPELPQIQAILPPFSRGLPTPVPGQHMGFGKKMLQKCEEILSTKYPSVNKLAVISGVGARQYYASRGYEPKGEYMVKDIDRDNFSF